MYYILQAYGLETQLNAVDKTRFVFWMRIALTPKNYFKLFYNASVFLIPAGSIFFAFIIEKYIKNIAFFFYSILAGFGFFLFFAYFQESHSIKDLQYINAGLVFIVTVCYWILKKRTQLLIFINKYWFPILVLMLFVILYNFGYLLETGIWVNYYHHNFVIATINDLFQGKHLLIDTFSQYGFLYPFFLYLIFLIGLPFSYMNFYWLLMILSMVYFFILFFFLRSLTKNTIYAFVGLFVILGLNTLFSYSTFPYSENYVWPGSIVARHFFDIVVFFLLYKNRRFSSRSLNWLSAFFTSLSFFYNFETGISLVFAFVILHFFHAVTLHTKTIFQRAIVFIRNLIPLFISLASIAGLFSLYTYMQTQRLPDWSIFWFFALLYQSGFTALQTPKIDWYLTYTLVYFSVCVWFLYAVVKKRTIEWKWYVIASLSFYGLFLLNYYLNRSYHTNLSINAISLGIILIVVLQEIYRNDSLFLKIVKYAIIIALLTISAQSFYYLSKRLKYRWYGWSVFKITKKYYNNRAFAMVSYVETEGYTVDDLFASVQAIKELTKNEKRILLFSRYDTVILVMAEKTHIIPYPMTEQIYYLSDVEKIKKELVSMKLKPAYLFIEKKNLFIPDSEIPKTSFSTSLELFNVLSPYYEFYKQVGILDIYRLKEISKPL